MKTKYMLLAFLGSLFFASCSEKNGYTILPDDKATLGKQIFSDTNLSSSGTQSCASCHAPDKGFSDPTSRSQSEGAVSGVFGNRNATALSYNVFSPARFYNNDDETFVGGFFWDGRAANLQAQAIGPMLNPVEMNNKDIHEVSAKIKTASYYSKLVSLYVNAQSDDQLMSFVTDALAKFETSREVNSFTSKFDYYSQGVIAFTVDEKKGLDLFQGKAKCANCHILDPDERTGKVLFTDFTYDNIGVPKNMTNPFYNQPTAVNPAGAGYIDLGIGAIVSQAQHNGRFKVPSLRNVAITGPYFHNGTFTTLNQVIRFYNRRDLKTGEFGPPEVSENVNVEELGDLKMTETEEQQLEIFLKTLTDHYRQS